jgi:hypothetical protein
LSLAVLFLLPGTLHESIHKKKSLTLPGIGISWDPSVILPASSPDSVAQPLLLCIPLEEYILEDDYFTNYELGLIIYEDEGDGETIITRALPEGIPGEIMDGFLCGNVTTPAIYVGVKVILDADDIYASLLAQGIVGSVLYWILLGGLLLLSSLLPFVSPFPSIS